MVKLRLFNNTKIRVAVDITLQSVQTDSVSIALTHMARFTNRVKKLEYSTEDSTIEKTIDGRTTYYSVDVSSNVQKQSWWGTWTLFFRYNNDIGSPFTVQVPFELEYRNPIIPEKFCKETSDTTIYLSLINGCISLAHLFILDQSKLNSTDVIL